jgi:hypothetical protein
VTLEAYIVNEGSDVAPLRLELFDSSNAKGSYITADVPPHNDSVIIDENYFFGGFYHTYDGRQHVYILRSNTKLDGFKKKSAFSIENRIWETP